jgi:hypothetical protein
MDRGSDECLGRARCGSQGVYFSYFRWSHLDGQTSGDISTYQLQTESRRGPARYTGANMAKPAVSDLRRRQIRQTLLWVAFGLFVTSMFLPAVAEGHECSKAEWAAGFEYFALGPLGVLDGQFGWFANPLMLFALLKNSRVAALLSVGLVSLTAFTWRSISGAGFPDSSDFIVCGFGSAFYLWFACAVLILIERSSAAIDHRS